MATVVCAHLKKKSVSSVLIIIAAVCPNEAQQTPGDARRESQEAFMSQVFFPSIWLMFFPFCVTLWPFSSKSSKLWDYGDSRSPKPWEIKLLTSFDQVSLHWSLRQRCVTIYANEVSKTMLKRCFACCIKNKDSNGSKYFERQDVIIMSTQGDPLHYCSMKYMSCNYKSSTTKIDEKNKICSLIRKSQTARSLDAGSRTVECHWLTSNEMSAGSTPAIWAVNKLIKSLSLRCRRHKGHDANAAQQILSWGNNISKVGHPFMQDREWKLSSQQSSSFQSLLRKSCCLHIRWHTAVKVGLH